MQKSPLHVWNGGTSHEGDSRCMQDGAITLQTKHVKAKKNNTDASSSPLHLLSPWLKAKIKNNAVFKDGD